MSKYAFYDFEFGILKIGYNDTAITFLKQVDQIDVDNEHSSLSDLAFDQIREYLKGHRRTFDFPYELHGTEFQKKVWNALCQVPYGETRTYKEIASVVGNAKASRAVGMANNKNPLMVVVPCHRIVGTDGNLIGYAGGLDMKKALLELEGKEEQ